MGGSLSHSLYTAEQVRKLDAEAIQNHRIPGIELMKRAGQAVFDAALKGWPALGRGGSLQVFCGAGNNGGDGYIIAALARRRYIPVRVIALKDPNLLKGDARKAWERFHDLGGHFEPWSPDIEINGTLVIDAMLGTGLSGDVKGDFADAISLINRSGRPVMAVDIPSGLSADTGSELGEAVKADLTVTFIGLKQGLYTSAGPRCCGRVQFARLNVPDSVYKCETPSAQLIGEQELSSQVHPRRRDAHKGDHGHLLVVGGDHGMGGAALMAAEAAMRCGVGLVTLATRAEHAMAAMMRCPEVMARRANTSAELQPLLKGKSAVVIGPGLGKDSWGKELLQTVLESDLPVLMDADALNIISESPELYKVRQQCVITPHPGEASRLLGKPIADIIHDRFQSVKELQVLCGDVAVLKGAGSLIQSENRTDLCNAGNPGMGVAGMGDVLSGVIGALIAQGHDTTLAASLGVWLHACAGDACAQADGERGIAATDLIPVIRQKLNYLAGQG
ncbi:NAD(P)H-hydrate dehydratase [Sansalvadorimonas sp. 2012CJ34-2]|uniref:Bifunctional NAD(P)H-hydrate repair enzyme n=1 Tax=Parendozoicomonas callyspongiae TaxID=2942213 RepID=A0ABT0PKV7_9GAMM|nr:NAD(P)H-hydrate dehydratase [Sansalvadorimonas sp. 2012CJ34-2]MCL6271973.1 NAD(P)H-hydrate dehydratase [Sansalvadorimonas sp. 2012CJ34-2]